MCFFLPSLKAFITLPNVEREVLMFLVYSSILPSTPVLANLSLPAKSIKVILEDFAYFLSKSVSTMEMANIMWDLDEKVFSLVLP
jgi:hypothetical protein